MFCDMHLIEVVEINLTSHLKQSTTHDAFEAEYYTRRVRLLNLQTFGVLYYLHDSLFQLLFLLLRIMFSKHQ